MLKVKNKERISKAAREKQLIKATPIRLPVDFSAENSQAKRNDIFKVLEEKKCANQEYYTQ